VRKVRHNKYLRSQATQRCPQRSRSAFFVSWTIANSKTRWGSRVFLGPINTLGRSSQPLDTAPVLAILPIRECPGTEPREDDARARQVISTDEGCRSAGEVGRHQHSLPQRAGSARRDYRVSCSTRRLGLSCHTVNPREIVLRVVDMKNPVPIRQWVCCCENPNVGGDQQCDQREAIQLVVAELLTGSTATNQDPST